MLAAKAAKASPTLLDDLTVGYRRELLKKDEQAALTFAIARSRADLIRQLRKSKIVRTLHSKDRYASRKPGKLRPGILVEAANETRSLLQLGEKTRSGRIQAAASSGLPWPHFKVHASEVARLRRILDARENELVSHNLGLTVEMAKRFQYIPGVDLAELLSEGRLALYRAVQGFDPRRGFQFSTYACRAILKAYTRYVAKDGIRKVREAPISSFGDSEARDPLDFLEDRRSSRRELDPLEALVERESCTRLGDQRFVEKALEPTEALVISHRFGVTLGETIGEEPLTLEEVGGKIDLTKERVRQIQNNALKKLGSAMGKD